VNARGTIIENLKTELESISVANGYQSDLNVTRDHSGVLLDRPSSEDLHTIKPTLAIIDGPPDVPMLYSSGTTVKTMGLGVVGFMKAAAYTESPRVAAKKLAADLEKLVAKPISLGSNVRFVELREIATGLISEDINEAHMLFALAISYWITNATP
jgi:hypothetical protein